MKWSNQYNRLVPEAGPEHFKTFSQRAPLSTHWRMATCEEYECEKFLNGFVLNINLSTDLGQQQFHYVTKVDRSRRGTFQRLSEHLVRVTYGPGNPCFEPEKSSHRIPIGRPPLLLVTGGDFRGNPRGIPVRQHRTPEDWADEFANHTNKLADRIKRG